MVMIDRSIMAISITIETLAIAAVSFAPVIYCVSSFMSTSALAGLEASSNEDCR